MQAPIVEADESYDSEKAAADETEHQQPAVNANGDNEEVKEEEYDSNIVKEFATLNLQGLSD